MWNIVLLVGVVIACAVVEWSRRTVERVTKSLQTAQLEAKTQKDRADFWKERTAEARADYQAEKDAHDVTRAEHVALLKSLVPGWLVVNGDTGAISPIQQGDPPSIGESDRRAAAAKREQIERERIRSGGMQPLVMRESGAQPPFRVDATAHDERDEDGDGS